jgi:hypothetical protein
VNAGQTFDAETFNPEIGKRTHQDFFQLAHVGVHVFTVRA